jgi:peptidylprolyl isomerase
MRKLSLLGCLLASTALTACGGSSGASPPPWKVPGTPAPPSSIQIPSSPPPKKVVIKDLRKGTGVRLKEGDWFAVNYIAFDYKTGRKEEAHWNRGGGFFWEFRKGRIVKGWIPGLMGMRVGGKRELTLPSRLAHNTGDIFYLIELLEVKPHA